MDEPFISALFTDSGRYASRKFAPKQLELPTFLLKKIDEHRRRALEKKLKHYDKIYRLNPWFPKIFKSQPKECIPPQKTVARESRKEPSWQLAPNRYTLQSPLMLAVSKQAGLKGPFQCFSVARNDATICGRNAPSKFVGSKQFIFNPPPGIGQTKSFSVRKSTFEKFPASKVQKRCAIQPGPTAYFEKIMAPKEFKETVQKPPDALNFYPGTSVPVTSIYVHKLPPSSMDPGRYELIDVFEIPGKGHGSVFKAQLLAPKFVSKKKVKSDFVMETNKVDFGREPHRPISFNPLSLLERPINVRLNTSLLDAGRRYKRATLKDVAFLSGTTRFGIAPFKNQLKIRPKAVLRPFKSSIPSQRPPIPSSSPVTSGERRLADRTGFSFAPMPEPKLIDDAINYEMLKLQK